MTSPYPDNPLAIDEQRNAELIKRRKTMLDLAYQAVESAAEQRTLAFNNGHDVMARGHPLHVELSIGITDSEAEWERVESIEDDEERGRELRKLKRSISRGERRRKAVTVHTRNFVALVDLASRCMRDADLVEKPPTTIEASMMDTLNPDSEDAKRRREIAKSWKRTDREQKKVEKRLEKVKGE